VSFHSSKQPKYTMTLLDQLELVFFLTTNMRGQKIMVQVLYSKDLAPRKKTR
jgi:hypothetical protein